MPIPSDSFNPLVTALPTDTITFLFTDIEGSTTLWEQYPNEMRPALARHDTLLREAIRAGNGYLVKATGDGVVAAFYTATEALTTALQAQQILLDERWPEVVALKVRMGLHTGDAEMRDGDYFGQALNRAARLTSAGYGGQVLLSDATQELCRDFLPPTVVLRNLGEHRLKDLTRPETVYQVTRPGLPDSFPPLRTLNNPDLPNNLPRQLTSFIGREKQIVEVTALLRKTSLLTLTGAGGSGKTRLGLQVAADRLDEYPDGVWMVELAALTDPALVPRAVAAVLGIQEQPDQALQQTLTENLKDKALLLLLDNCEHLIAACAAFVAVLLRSCPEVRVLATSREPLGIAGEQTYRVPSLSLPDARQAQGATLASLSQYEAVRLFIERALAVRADFTVTNANAPALAQLCYRLDGIPLALELAAARVRSLSVEDINRRLDSRFRLLTGGDRAALPRQQTLRSLVDWSYDLLNGEEQTLFARLSVFAGGWALEAAEPVCGFAPLDEDGVLDLLSSLVDKSLVQIEEDQGVARYRMLETLRQYATEKCEAGGETVALRARQRDWAVAFAEAGNPKLTGPEQSAWLSALETEHDNLRTALDWCAAAETENEEPGLRLVGALWRFWYVRGYLTEGRDYSTRALEKTPAPSRTALRARVCNGAGNIARLQGDYEAARALCEESLALSRALEDGEGLANALNNLGIIAKLQGDYDGARALYEESLALRRARGDTHGVAIAFNNLGNMAAAQGDYAAARPQYEESLALYRTLGDKQGIASALSNLGSILYTLGDYATARALGEESLSLRRELGNKHGIANSLSNLGSVIYSQGDSATARGLYEESLVIKREVGDRQGVAYSLEGLASVALSEADARKAVVLWGAVDAVRESIGMPREPGEVEKYDRQLERARELLDIQGAAVFPAAWAEGRAFAWGQAVAYALGEGATDSRTKP